MKTFFAAFLLLLISMLFFSCSDKRNPVFTQNEGENMHQFIQRIAVELNPESTYEVMEWTDWKLNDKATATLCLLKNTSSNLLEFKVIKQNDAGKFEVHTIAPLESSKYTKLQNVTWSFPHYEAIDFDNDKLNEFVILAEATGIQETDEGMLPINENMTMCFALQDDHFVEISSFNEDVAQLPAIQMILNQPELSMAGQGTLNSTADMLSFLQEIEFLTGKTEEKMLVSIVKKGERFAYDKCINDGVSRIFNNETQISDPAYLPVFVENDGESVEYTFQFIEELSDNNYEAAVIAVNNLENQQFDKARKINIFWNGVWVLQMDDFYYTTRKFAKQLKQIDRDCPEI